MNVLDLTLPTPAENLALDEALLDNAEATGSEEVLRFWEPQDYFVVVGYANKVDVEVNRAACASMNVPIYRRCSGGGTVLQGPGCLNYALILKIESFPQLATVPQTNDFIMSRQKEAIQRALKWPNSGQLDTKSAVDVRGHTDLALGDIKFSGNAQRRKRDFILFHGTLLLNFDLERVENLLRMPSKEPDYRHGRPHREFLRNICLTSEQPKAALMTVWKAGTAVKSIPDVKGLVAEKYSRPEWNLKF